MNTISAYELGILVARNNAGMQKLAQMPPSAPAPTPPAPLPSYYSSGRNFSQPNLNQAYQQIDAQTSPKWLTQMVMQNPGNKNLQNVRFEPHPYPGQPIPQGQRSYMSASRVPVNPYYKIMGDADGKQITLGEIKAPNIYTNANINPSNVSSVLKSYVQQGW